MFRRTPLTGPPMSALGQKQRYALQQGMSATARSGHSEAATCAVLEQASCVYLDCRRSPLFLSVCDTSNSSKANKKDCGFWRGAVTIVGAQVRCLL